MSETRVTDMFKRESLTGSQILGLCLYCRKDLLRRLVLERISTKCMEGVGKTLSRMHLTSGQTALCLHLISLPTVASLFNLILVLHAGPQYQLGLRLAGVGHRSSLAMRCHSQLARPHALFDADRAS